MEHLYYDRIAKMFTLDLGPGEDAGIKFLGPATQTLLVLQREHGLTASQAREAVLQAMLNLGDAVCLDLVKRIASESGRDNTPAT